MGMQMEALAGHPAIRSYPGLSYEYIPLGVPSDAAGGVGAAFAFLMGVRYRDQSGHGVEVEAATTENFVPLLGEFLMDYTMNGRVPTQMGNDHFWLAPHNVYTCRGTDRWVTIACRTDEEWRRLAEIMHRPELAEDERFATMEARYAHRGELDPLITEWTSTLEPRWIFHRLQRDGIPAGVVYPEAEVFEDRHLRERGFFLTVTHPEAGTHEYAGPAWLASHTPREIWRHAPRLGEDNEYVYRELLGFSDEEYRHFEELGHIGMDYDPSVL
jgi:benzylsuccinate CoA-transferase BbsF subunit